MSRSADEISFLTQVGVRHQPLALAVLTSVDFRYRFAVAGLHTGSRHQSRRPIAAIDLCRTTRGWRRGQTRPSSRFHATPLSCVSCVSWFLLSSSREQLPIPFGTQCPSRFRCGSLNLKKLDKTAGCECWLAAMRVPFPKKRVTQHDNGDFASEELPPRPRVAACAKMVVETGCQAPHTNCPDGVQNLSAPSRIYACIQP